MIWAPHDASSPSPTGVQELPDPVRVTLVGGETLELRQARLEGDSTILGVANNSDVRRISLSTVEKMEHRVHNVGGTAFLTLLGILAGGYLLLLTASPAV